LINVKPVLKKRQSKLEGGVLEDSKTKVVKLGKCSGCGKILVRFNEEINTAVCMCKSVVEVPLTLSFSRQRYDEVRRLAKENGWSLQWLLNGLLEIEEAKGR
jgi:hypothetical protein